MTCQAPTPCEMTSQPGRRSEACIKGRQETIKMLQTLITSRLLPTLPSPNHTPFTPTNTPNMWDSNAIYRVQIDGELTEIWQLGRINRLNHVYLDEFFMLFLETQTYACATLSRAWWAFFHIFLSHVGGLSPTMTQTWHFETMFPQSVNIRKSHEV